MNTNLKEEPMGIEKTSVVVDRMLSPLFMAGLVLVLNLVFAPGASGAITVVSYWRIGEFDPGASPGVAATGPTDTAIGAHNLKAVGQAYYSNNVAVAALAHVSSSLSLNFASGAFASNSIVSTATDNFGIEAWVKPTSVNAGQVIAYNGSTATSGWGIMVSGSNYLALFGGRDIWGVGAATPNVWTHVALVRDGGVATIYTNGIAAGTSVAFPNVPSGNFALAAPPQAPNSQFLTGSVDEVRVFAFAPGQFSTNDLLLNKPVYAVGTTSLLEGPAAGNDSVTLAVSPETVTWTATANAAWLHLNAANQGGTGSTNVIFTFDANAGATRTGTLTIAGQTVTVTQAGASYVAARPVRTVVSSGTLYPNGLAVDASGNLYIADSGYNAIREWIPASNTLTTLLDGGLSYPSGVAVDGSGNVYIADKQNHLVKKLIVANNTAPILVPSGLSYPAGVAVDRWGNVYIADSNHNAVKKWSVSDGSVTTLISSGLYNPSDVAVDVAGNLYIADTSNHSIKKWNAANGTVTPLVSSGLNYPYHLAVDGSGNVYISDSFNSAIRKWIAANNTVTTFGGWGGTIYAGVAVDSTGNMYACDQINSLINEQPYVFVDPASKTEGTNSGTDVLSMVLPATANMTGAFTPTSDQPWLTIGGVTNGVVSFSFTANTGADRTAHINLFGVSISVSQAGVITPPLLTDARMLANGAFQFSFTNNPAGSFTVVTTTNVSLPLSQWTVAGVPTNVSPGLFQFTSGPGTNGPKRFYSVRSP
jgi:DNA-binding beta-propeller fold protein YncE